MSMDNALQRIRANSQGMIFLGIFTIVWSGWTIISKRPPNPSWADWLIPGLLLLAMLRLWRLHIAIVRSLTEKVQDPEVLDRLFHLVTAIEYLVMFVVMCAAGIPRQFLHFPL
jgi:hypothetical protein